MTERDRFFENLRGKALMHFDGHSLELDLGLTHNYYTRIEIVSPLGARLALLQVNQESVQLYLIRDQTVFRFPTREFFKDTARRDRFLALLPVRIIPELFFDAVLNRLALGSLKSFDCRFDRSENLYLVRSVEESGTGEGRWIEIDPTTYSPLRILYFPQKTPRFGAEESPRPLYEVRFASPLGEGFSTLESKIEFVDAISAPASRKSIRFEWIRAEAWENPSPQAFQWQAPEGINVKDY